MTEPLMRRLAARGEQITVGALPWVAPVYRAMPQVAAVLELPFAHGGLQWGPRRALARTLQGQFDAAYVCPNSFKSALLPWWAGIAKRVGYRGEARVGVLTDRLPNPPKGTHPPMVAFYSALSGDADVADDRPALHLPAADVAAALDALRFAARPLLRVFPWCRIRPGQTLAAAALCRAGHAPGVARGVAGLGQRKRAVPEHCQCHPRRHARALPGFVGPHHAGPGLGRDCRGQGAGQQ